MIEKRTNQGKKASPSLLAIDSQSDRRYSAKSAQFVSENIGIDRGKNINRRKRTILVDKLGLPLVIHVTAANISDYFSLNPAFLIEISQNKKFKQPQSFMITKQYLNIII